VTVGENVSGDFYTIADGAFDGETSAVNFRLNIFNHHSSSGNRGLDGAFPARHFSARH
jgi:hypothetical protein